MISFRLDEMELYCRSSIEFRSKFSLLSCAFSVIDNDEAEDSRDKLAELTSSLDLLLELEDLLGIAPADDKKGKVTSV